MDLDPEASYYGGAYANNAGSGDAYATSGGNACVCANTDDSGERNTCTNKPKCHQQHRPQ
jgi:hypothetical protein